MRAVDILIGGERFLARFQSHLAPRTCERVAALFPWTCRLIHARWSGEACWIPLGSTDLGLSPESPTGAPRPGELIVYPGGQSEAEVLLAYGTVRFGCRAGPLAGNPLLRVDRNLDRLAAVGERVLWEGACDITFSLGSCSAE